MKIEIWIEGYRATGEEGTAQKLGEYEADNFDQAMEMFMKDNPGQVDVHVPSPETQTRRHNKGYDKVHYSIWACSLFNNETDARRAYG